MTSSTEAGGAADRGAFKIRILRQGFNRWKVVPCDPTDTDDRWRVVAKKPEIQSLATADLVRSVELHVNLRPPFNASKHSVQPLPSMDIPIHEGRDVPRILLRLPSVIIP